jgi:ribosomal protein L7/L12
MADRTGFDLRSLDPLIDAEREALARSGRSVSKIALIKAVREEAGLSLRDAKGAVEGYLARRGGLIPPDADPSRPAGWIDDLLDAERAAAAREDRRVTKILLIKALRDASGLGLRDAKVAVEDYLRRRGGEGLPTGGNPVFTVALVVILLALGAAVGVAVMMMLGKL